MYTRSSKKKKDDQPQCPFDYVPTCLVFHILSYTYLMDILNFFGVSKKNRLLPNGYYISKIFEVAIARKFDVLCLPFTPGFNRRNEITTFLSTISDFSLVVKYLYFVNKALFANSSGTWKNEYSSRSKGIKGLLITTDDIQRSPKKILSCFGAETFNVNVYTNLMEYINHRDVKCPALFFNVNNPDEQLTNFSSSVNIFGVRAKMEWNPPTHNEIKAFLTITYDTQIGFIGSYYTPFNFTEITRIDTVVINIPDFMEEEILPKFVEMVKCSVIDERKVVLFFVSSRHVGDISLKNMEIGNIKVTVSTHTNAIIIRLMLETC